MDFLLALTIGLLYAAGLYMILRRSLVKLIIGLVLLGHAANLLIFTVGKLTKGNPPIIDQYTKQIIEPFSDPVPQALVLTAIVIGFGVQAFFIVLLKKSYKNLKTDDLDKMNTTDSLNY